MSELKIEAWVKAGYKLLSTDGLEGIKIERLARELSLNKSGFYYYFGTMEEFIKNLLQYHVHVAKEVAREIAKCEKIDPDLLHLVVQHKTFFLVESELLVKSRISHGGYEMDEAGKIIIKELVLLWRRDNNIPGDESVTLGYLNIIRHFIYARIDAGKMNYQFLYELADETKKAFERVSH